MPLLPESLLPNATDRQFRRFCRTGDPAALGAVFDRTAAELLRVACWLAGNRADAEDLVQRTFLAAIERRAAFAENGRALPWLIGILGNLARQLQRERRRVPPAPVESIADPSTAAAHTELEERLARLRADLGTPYAEVLQLHLEQGLAANEIAARLARPAGTVRTQLVRALALLRERLPSGFVAGGALALASTSAAHAAAPALAAIRREVVRAAGSPAAAGSVVVPVVIAGAWFVSKPVAAVVSLLVATSLFAFAWPWHAGLAEPTVDGSLPAPAAVARVADESPHASLANDREAPTGAEVRGAEGRDARFATLRVRVRFDERTPAAGVGVFADNGHAAARRDAVTGDDGTVELAQLIPGPWRIGAVLGDGVERCTLVAGDVRTIELSASRRAIARGTVVDASDRPVAGAHIWQSHDGDHEHGNEVTVTADDGTFTVPLFGAHSLAARKAGFLQSREVIANPRNADSSFVLRLDRPGGVLRGVVVDERGAPVPRAKVLVGEQYHRRLEDSVHPLGHEYAPRGVEVVAASDGSFATDVAPVGRVRLAAWGVGFAPFADWVDVAAQGESRVTIVLRPGAQVAGVVRDTGGEPVVGASVSWAEDHEFAHATAVTGADGRYVLADLPAGREILRAELRNVRVELWLEPRAGERTPWNPVLTLDRLVRGRVVDAKERALAGFTVTAWRGAHHLAEQTTAADGSFTLRDVGDGALTVEVWHDEQTLDTRDDVIPDTTELVLALSREHLPTATLEGRIVDERGHAIDATIVPSRAGVRRHKMARTGADGAFVVRGLRPGRYRVGVSSALGEQSLGEVDVAPDAVLDLGERVLPTPGAVELRVTANGRPVASGRVMFKRPDGEWVGDGVIEQGVARHTALPAGTLHAFAHVEDLELWTELTIVAGATTRAALALLPTLCATVTLRDPLERSREELGARVVARRSDGTFAGVFAEHTQEGRRVLVHLPADTYRLHVTTRDGRRAELDVDLRAGNVTHTCELPRE